MNIGSIHLDDNFKFSDGNTGRKLFVIVSISKNGTILVCKTTSKERPPHRLRKQGCSAHKNYYMFMANEDWFNKDTWVQFEVIYEMEKERLSKKTKYQEKLKNKNIKALLNCILRSEDIPKETKNIIKPSLKSLS